MNGEGEIEGSDDRGEEFDELGLKGELIGVPNAVEEALPELLHVVVRDLSLVREPVL